MVNNRWQLNRPRGQKSVWWSAWQHLVGWESVWLSSQQIPNPEADPKSWGGSQIKRQIPNQKVNPKSWGGSQILSFQRNISLAESLFGDVFGNISLAESLFSDLFGDLSLVELCQKIRIWNLPKTQDLGFAENSGSGICRKFRICQKLGSLVMFSWGLFGQSQSSQTWTLQHRFSGQAWSSLTHSSWSALEAISETKQQNVCLTFNGNIPQQKERNRLRNFPR